jgi:four helix bundle protein
MDDRRAFYLSLTKKLGLETIFLSAQFPSTIPAKVIAYQIVKSATSTGCNYRAVCKARSTAEFISKMQTVEEESDETLYWLEMLEESGIMNKEKLADLKSMANHITAMAAKSKKTAKKRKYERNNSLTDNRQSSIENKRGDIC